MSEQTVRLSVPADPTFARSVRMMAASLAVACDMNVDEVEDVRMAAEEGFVYCCATNPAECNIAFGLSKGQVRMSYDLAGEPVDDDDSSLDLVELLLSAVCDEFGVSEDGSQLVLVKRAVAYDD